MKVAQLWENRSYFLLNQMVMFTADVATNGRIPKVRGKQCPCKWQYSAGVGL